MKIGDRIVVKGNQDRGTICAQDGKIYQVHLDSGGYEWFGKSEIKKV